MKKKALSLLIVICLILGMVPTAVFAADQTSSEAGVRIQYVENSYDAGTGVFKVNVQAKLPAGVGISSLGVILSFDNTKLTLINQNNGNDLPGNEGSVQAPKAAAIKVLLADEDEYGSPISYSMANGDLYKSGERSALYTYLYTTDVTTGAMNSGDWFDCFQVAFKSSAGDPASKLDSSSLRIADASKDNTVIKGVLPANDIYTVYITDNSNPAKIYCFNKMADNTSGDASDDKFVMDSTGTGDATYPGSTNQPPKAAYYGAAATISNVAKSGDNVVVTAAVPNGETAQYGYSTTSDAAAVTNWQDSNSFSAPAPGTYYFFARVKENVSHKAGGESVGTAYTVNGPLSLSYSAPASMTVDSAIAAMDPTVSGGTGSYTNFAVTSGTLPTGLNINSAGVISGTPTAVAEATQVTVTVTDSESSTTTYQINFPAVAKKANTMNSVTQADVEYGTAVNPSATSNGNTPTYQYKDKGANDNTYTNDVPTTVGEYTVKASSTGHATVADAIVTTDFKITPKTLTNLGFTGVR